MSAISLSATEWEVVMWVVRTAGLVLSMLVLTLAFKHWRRSQERSAERMFEQLDLLRSELLTLTERMEQRPAPAAPAMMRAPQPEQRSAPPTTTAPSPRGYEVAARLARGGATVDELIRSCGLSRNEAQLVMRLHGKQEPTPTVARAPAAQPAAREAAPRRARLSVVG